MGKPATGFTLIETMLASATLVIFFTAASLIVQTGLQAIGSAKMRGEATRIAQERLEYVRNLSYEDVGTVGGIPAGQLAAHEVVTVNGVDYIVDTSVLYVDDAFDGKAPADLLPVDYKRIKVSISWEGLFKSVKPLILLTDAAPKGVEMADNAGTLSILVFNSQGVAVSDALVHIEAAVVPAVNMNVNTDENGMVIIPGAPICDSCYKISATKTGYTSDRTYGTDEVATPIKPHVTILEGMLSPVSFAIDTMASITFRVTRNKASSYSPFVGAQFTLTGTKEVGRDALDDPVYKVVRTVVSSTGGLATVSNLEWDTYDVSIPGGSSIDLAGTWPFLPIAILPGSSTNVAMVVQADTTHSLWVQIVDELTQPVGNALVELSDGITIATESSGIPPYGDTGQVFFDGLTQGPYSVQITAAGFATASGTVSVFADVTELYKISHRIWDTVMNYRLSPHKQTGFTVIEIAMTTAILGMVILITAAYWHYVIQNYEYSYTQYQMLDQASQAVRQIATELRQASEAMNGAYPLAIMEDNQLAFYADVNDDGGVERRRYFIEDGVLKRGVTEPSGNPPSYNFANETVTYVTENIDPSQTPLFTYYNGNWPGDVVNNPLAYAVRPLETRLIRIMIPILIHDINGDQTYKTDSVVQIRNLKNNW